MSQRKLILSMQITLDGFVAGPNDEGDWIINSDEEWDDLFTDLDGADTYLLGRKMYPLYSTHWQSVLQNPDSPANELKFAKLAAKTRHIVFTKGSFQPDWNNTRVAHDLPAEVERLKATAGKNIIAWGGANFASQLIQLGLVDEFRFALNPTLLVDGKALFEHQHQRQQWALIHSKPLSSGLVVLRYQLQGERA